QAHGSRRSHVSHERSRSRPRVPRQAPARRQDRSGPRMIERLKNPETAPTVCYLAHCLLNANAKVDEGARCPGVYSPVIEVLRRKRCTIRQMPCPELAFGGLRRFWAVREQYDTPAFREHCKRLAAPVVAQIRADLKRP